MMPSVDEIRSLETVIAACVWAIVIAGVARAFFRGYVGEEIASRLNLQEDDRLRRVERLNYEVANGVRHDPKVVRKDPTAVPVPLSQLELDSRRAALAGLQDATLLVRAGRYWLSCPFCQAFWVAVLAFPFAHGWAWPGTWLASAVLYAMLANGMPLIPRSGATGERKGGGCNCGSGGCGGGK